MFRPAHFLALFVAALSTLIAAPERPAELTLEGKNHPVVLRELAVDPGSALGLAMIFGRRFVRPDFGQGAPPVAIVSETLWREVFRRQPDVIGRKIVLAHVETIIVGVARDPSPDAPARRVWATRPLSK